MMVGATPACRAKWSRGGSAGLANKGEVGEVLAQGPGAVGLESGTVVGAEVGEACAIEGAVG